MKIESYCPGCNRRTTRKPLIRKLSDGRFGQYIECKHCGDVTMLRHLTTDEYNHLQRGQRRMRLIRRAGLRRARLGAK